MYTLRTFVQIKKILKYQHLIKTRLNFNTKVEVYGIKIHESDKELICQIL